VIWRWRIGGKTEHHGGRLTQTKGIAVYASNGIRVGHVSDVYLDGEKPVIYGWVIKLDKKLANKLRKDKVLIRQRHVSSVNNVMIVEAAVAEKLEHGEFPDNQTDVKL
jgi:sporulation protein YlmC with PRC-barrel domain